MLLIFQLSSLGVIFLPVNFEPLVVINALVCGSMWPICALVILLFSTSSIRYYGLKVLYTRVFVIRAGLNIYVRFGNWLQLSINIA